MDVDPKSLQTKLLNISPVWPTWSWHGQDIYRGESKGKKDTQKRIASPEKCRRGLPFTPRYLGETPSSYEGLNLPCLLLFLQLGPNLILTETQKVLLPPFPQTPTPFLLSLLVTLDHFMNTFELYLNKIDILQNNTNRLYCHLYLGCGVDRVKGHTVSLHHSLQ